MIKVRKNLPNLMCQFGIEIDDFQLRGIRAGFIPGPLKAWVALLGYADSTAFQISVRFRIFSIHNNSTYFYAFNLSGKNPFCITKFQGSKTKRENNVLGYFFFNNF